MVVFGASSDAILLFVVIRARKTKPALSLRMVSRETDTQPLIGWLVRKFRSHYESSSSIPVTKSTPAVDHLHGS